MYTPSFISRAVVAAFVVLTVSAKGADYPSTVVGDGPLVYYRLNDSTVQDIAANSGTLGVGGNGTYSHLPNQETEHRVVGALVGGGGAAAGFQSSDGSPVLVPLNPALNTSKFAVEAWVQATSITDDSAGPCPLFNRKSSGARQGWAIFQRSPGTGWNLRMYGNGVDSSTTVSITGGAYNVGDWVHLVATYDGTTARLYLNGAEVANGNPSAYQGNTVAAFSVGSYSDLLGSGPAYQNPFFGNEDEVALYTNALSAAQVLAHYQNGTNAARTTPYETLIAADSPVEYLRLDEANALTSVAANSGSLGVDGDGLHFPGATHQVAGALAGSSDTAILYSAIDTNSNDGGVPTIVPWNAALNPGGSFTVEGWLMPTIPTLANQQCPLYNRISTTSGAFVNRAGWDIFQQPSGWRFRMFNGSGGSTMFNITGGPLIVNGWQHVVAVYDASVPKLTLYVNGVQAATSSTPNGTFAPNNAVPFAIGGFPLYSNGHYENPFTGAIDEVALYSTALSASQVLAHYQNGTNAARTTPYATLVTTDGAVGYWRLNEPARNVAANLGTLGAAANGTYAVVQSGTYIGTNNANLPGPQDPAFLGFETNNMAANSDGLSTYTELGNPPALNISGPITMEAWIQPSVFLNTEAYIIGHGYNDDGTAEDVLRVEGGNYTAGSYNGANHQAQFAVPGEDLGTAHWVHLVGTYDGANWNLFRNGLQVATNADVVGAVAVNNANWAIGARGRWKFSTGLDRLFTGAIDEVAIYNYALSPARVAFHYSVGLATLHPLQISAPGGVITITWTVGTLQEATAVTGPYADVSGAGSPYTPTAGPTKKFYRLRF